jgi:hypothetical protein
MVPFSTRKKLWDISLISPTSLPSLVLTFLPLSIFHNIAGPSFLLGDATSYGTMKHMF